MLHIITDTRNTLAGFILQGLAPEDSVNIIEFPKDKRSLWQKTLRYVEAKFGIIGTGCYLPPVTKQQLQHIQPEDSVLIFDIDYHRDLLILKQHIPSCKKLSLFLWNPVQNHDAPSQKALRNIRLLRKNFAHICTFDPEDAKQHQLQFIPQPYRDLNAPSQASTEDIDLYFIGSDKGRLQQLINIKQAAESLGLRCLFHITPSKRYSYTPEQEKHLTHQHLSYAENIALARRSKCLVEVVQANQTGPTIRALEAAFLGKKLITNRQHAKNAATYTPEMVWITSEVTPDELQSFLARPCSAHSAQVLATHEIRSWIKNFE